MTKKRRKVTKGPSRQESRGSENKRAVSATGHVGDHRAAHDLYLRVRNSAEALEMFNAAILFAHDLIYMTCSSRLQREAITKLLCAIELAQREKGMAQKDANSQRADYFLGMQCFAHGLCHIMEMWILLKEGKNLTAWIHKVDAEDYLRVAHQALSQSYVPQVAENLVAIASLRERMMAYDRLVFPPLMFTSPGFKYTKAHCSVCGQDLDICDHVEGQIYCGKVCLMVRMEGIDYNHLAFVSDPRDRRCVVASFPREGKARDSFTREIVPGTPGDQADVIFSRYTLLPDMST